MLSHAKAELPNECCGLLAGRTPEERAMPGDPVARVQACYPLVNAAASPVEYLSEPRSIFEAVREMRRLGLEIVAAYHSHPTSEPVPSRKDRERNYSADVMNLIISLKGDEPVVRGWWLTEQGFREAKWEVGMTNV